MRGPLFHVSFIDGWEYIAAFTVFPVSATTVVQAMKQEADLGAKWHDYTMKNQYTVYIVWVNQRDNENKKKCFFHVICYEIMLPQGWIQELKWSPDPLVGKKKPCLQTTVPKWVSPWEGIRGRWRPGLMERDRPGATGSIKRCRHGEKENADMKREWERGGNDYYVFSGDQKSKLRKESILFPFSCSPKLQRKIPYILI